MFVEIAKPRLTPVQSILGPLAIGYIVARRDDAIDSAVGRAQRCDLKINPSNFSAASGVLEVPPYRLARKAPCDQLRHRRIGPARRIGERLADHGLTGSVDGLQHLHVGLRYPSFFVEQADIAVVSVDNLTEALLALSQHRIATEPVGSSSLERRPELTELRYARFKRHLRVGQQRRRLLAQFSERAGDASCDPEGEHERQE